MLVAVAVVCRPARARGGETTAVRARPPPPRRRRHRHAAPTVPATNLDGTRRDTRPPRGRRHHGHHQDEEDHDHHAPRAVKGARPNDQVVVQVLNGSGISGRGHHPKQRPQGAGVPDGSGRQCTVAAHRHRGAVQGRVREGSPGPRHHAPGPRRPVDGRADRQPAAGGVRRLARTATSSSGSRRRSRPTRGRA